MSTVIDVLLVVFVLLGTYAGWKKGLIKSLVSLIGLVAIILISFYLKNYLAEFLIDKMPFFNFAGFEGLTSLNILIYNVISFVVIFIVLYCILNVIIAVTGIIDTILKLTVIWVLPSKIGGAIIGFLESWVFAFLVLTVLSSFNVTANMMLDSKGADIVLNHTPVIGKAMTSVTNGAREIYQNIKDTSKDEDRKELNKTILSIAINNNLITVEKANELIETGKLDLGKVTIVKPGV